MTHKKKDSTVDVVRVLIERSTPKRSAELVSRCQRVGLDAMSIEDSAQLYQQIRQNQADLLILDVTLKNPQDGVELGHRLYQQHNIPIIYLDRDAQRESWKCLKEAKPFGYLVEPFSDRELHCVTQLAICRARVEKSLRKSNNWFHGVLGNIDEGVIATDTEQSVLFMNPAAQQMTGWSETEAYGRNLSDVLCLTSIEERKPICLPTKRAVEERRGIGLDQGVVLQTPNDATIPVWVGVAPVTTETGDVHGTVISMRDIEQLTSATLAEERTRRQYRDMVEALDAYFYVCSADYRIEYMNPKLKQRTGRDATGEKCYKALQNRETICPWCPSKAVQGGKTVRWEEFSPIDNRWYYGINTPLYNPDGSVSQQSIMLDITDRKNTEQALRESEAKYRALAANFPNGTVHLFDRDLRFQISGGELLEKFGITSADLEGKTVHDINPPEIAEQLERNLQKALQGEPCSFEITCKNRELDVQTLPITDQEGSIIGVISVSQDMTERKRVERRLRAASNLETLGELAGGIAHHFNNILTVILGHAQMLTFSPESRQGVLESAEAISQAAKRATDLTAQFLAFGRKTKISKGELDVHDSIREAMDLLQPSVGQSVRFRQDLQATHTRTEGDSNQMQSAILHLGLNACEAMDSNGELQIATQNVRIEEQDISKRGLDLKPGRYIKVDVIDNGIGMDAQTRSRLFEPFFTTKKVGQGVGLGLSGTYGTVRSMGGDIEVESEPGKGSTFTLYLPVKQPSKE